MELRVTTSDPVERIPGVRGFPRRWTRFPTLLPKLIVHPKDVGDEVLEGRRLVPDDEVFYVLREPPSKTRCSAQCRPSPLSAARVRSSRVYSATLRDP